jgi:hypothetical protein
MLKIFIGFLTVFILISVNMFFLLDVIGSEQTNTTLQHMNIGSANSTTNNITNNTENLISPLPRGPIFETSILIDNENELPISVENLGNNTFLYEGDILFSLPVLRTVTNITNNLTDFFFVAIDRFLDTDPWTNATVPYQIDPNIPRQSRIIDAIEHWEANTPIRFIELNDTNREDYSNYIAFAFNQNFPDSTNPICASRVGMVGGEQKVYVPNWCQTGSIIHEIGHLIGLWHEQTRCDRNEYIEIHLENVHPLTRHNWENKCFDDPNLEKQNPDSPVGFGEYDYCSIEHYGRFGGSINGEPVLIPKKPVVGCDDIGQRNGLSQKDIAGVNSIYSISNVVTKITPLPPNELRNLSEGGNGPLVLNDPRSTLVTHLQIILKKLGYDLGNFGPNNDGIDGKFGKKTFNAITDFQKTHTDLNGVPLTPDGKVGRLTAESLNKAVGS